MQKSDFQSQFSMSKIFFHCDNIMGVAWVYWRIYSLGVVQYIQRREALRDILLNPEGVYSPIQYGYIIEAAISYYPIRNGWEMGYGKNGFFYYKTIQDCRSHDLQNIGLKIHNFSLELKQSKTPPTASCWSVSTLVRRYVFFNPRFCKS